MSFTWLYIMYQVKLTKYNKAGKLNPNLYIIYRWKESKKDKWVWELLFFQFCNFFFLIARFWCETPIFFNLRKDWRLLLGGIKHLRRAWVRAALAHEVFDFVSKKKVKKFRFWMKIGFWLDCLRGPGGDKNFLWLWQKTVMIDDFLICNFL